MDTQIRRKLDYIDSIVANDPVYGEMLHRCSVLEKRFDAMVKELPEDSRALA